ncbi:hypothetical protein GCM10010913_13820 [Paenibacillus aceti]|uniref:Uncharacterized protein n=1 Tax=Paenibacillus aceti TaxID=1820010 RepID=A0ABQ1VT93_9BACL|nr:hypothetical protein GCM10010913_13820 [Paenibacillus aceti]
MLADRACLPVGIVPRVGTQLECTALHEKLVVKETEINNPILVMEEKCLEELNIILISLK